jgi:nitrite reductase/ring-hydroxylating ferredoxin subunit
MLEELADGKGRSFSWGAGKDAYGVIVVRRGDDAIAFVNRCPHFQVPLAHRETVTTFRDFILCNQHYAAFRFADGYCVEGPCQGASLTRVPIDIDRGRIRIAAGDPNSVL